MTSANSFIYLGVTLSFDGESFRKRMDPRHKKKY